MRSIGVIAHGAPIAAIIIAITTAFTASGCGRAPSSAHAALAQRVGVRVLEPAPESVNRDAPLVWRRLTTDEPAPARLVLLIHGLDEPGDIWDCLARALRDHGFAAARFDYPNDQPILDSVALLHESLQELHALGIGQVDLVTHSMGGLLAREALTCEAMYAGLALGHETLPDVGSLVMVGTPNRGVGVGVSTLRFVAEIREQVARWCDPSGRDAKSAFAWVVDGAGEAGADLRVGSALLEALNARPRPERVRILAIVAKVAPVEAEEVEAWFDASAGRRRAGAVGLRALALEGAGLLRQAGDGIVPRTSSLYAGADAVELVKANHRSALRWTAPGRWVRNRLYAAGANPPAVAPIIEWLMVNEAQE